MKEKLIVSSSPHLRGNSTTQRIMLDVIIAMLPAAAASIVFFGYWAAITLAVSVASCVLSEFVCRLVMKREQTVGDLSAVVTGMLLAFNLPATINPLITAFGGIVAIVVAKQMFGGPYRAYRAAGILPHTYDNMGNAVFLHRRRRRHDDRYTSWHSGRGHRNHAVLPGPVPGQHRRLHG